MKHKIENRPLRFDVVAVVLGPKGPPVIRHYETSICSIGVSNMELIDAHAHLTYRGIIRKY